MGKAQTVDKVANAKVFATFLFVEKLCGQVLPVFKL